MKKADRRWHHSRGGKRKRWERVITGLVCMSLFVAGFSGASFMNGKKAQAQQDLLSAPRIEDVEDGSTKSGKKSTWDCVWFGDYPQAEVISDKGSYKGIKAEQILEGDLIEDSGLYQKLQEENGWDAQNYKLIGRTRYIRVKSATENQTSGSPEISFYDWTKGVPEYHYFQCQPIKWRILEVDDNQQALLLADKALDVQPYNGEMADVTWESSSIRQWLNEISFSDDSDAIIQGFLGKAFLNESRRAAIKSNEDGDRVFLLSYETLQNPLWLQSHGFIKEIEGENETMVAKSSSYAKALGLGSVFSLANSYAPFAGNCYWWLCRPGLVSNRTIAMAAGNGKVVLDDYSINAMDRGVRPCLLLDLNATVEDGSKVYSYAGTVCSDGTKEEVPFNTDGIAKGERGVECQSEYSMEPEESRTIYVAAYSDSQKKLEELTESIAWKSADENIAKVEKYKVGPIYSTEAERREIQQDDNGGYYNLWTSALILTVTAGKDEGETQIIFTAKDVEDSTCQITVSKPVAAEEIAPEPSGSAGGRLTVGDDRSVSDPPNKDVQEMFPVTDWTLQLLDCPVSFTKETDEDGNTTYKGKVGIASASLDGGGNGEAQLLDWESIKHDITECVKGGFEDCSEIVGSIGGQKFKTIKLEKGIEGEVSLAGYYETKLDKNNNIIESSGNLVGDGKVELSVGHQMLLWMIPVYYNIGAGISGELSAGLETKYDDKKILKPETKSDIKFKLEPKLTLEGGVGIDKIANVHAQGELLCEMQILPQFDATLEGKAKVGITLAFCIERNKELASFKFPLDVQDSKSNVLKRNPLEIPKDTFSEIDTSFAEKTGVWNGGIKGKKRASGSGVDSILTLQEGILPSSLPVQVKIGGKNVMVFQGFDNTRTTLNGTVLKYSVQENGVWSEPKAVANDGCADLFADMKVVNNKLVLVWQKVKKQISGDVETNSSGVLKDIAQNSEIYFSTFDKTTNTFSKPVAVTNNGCSDAMPRICDNSNEVIISWVRNSDDMLMQETGTNSFYTAKWNGSSFEGEKLLAVAPGTINDYVLYQNGEELQAVYTGQSDGISALFKNGQVHTKFLNLMMKESEGTISGLNYSDGEVCCIAGGKLYSHNISTNVVSCAAAGEGVFGSAVQYCSNGGKTGCIWSIYDEETGIGSIRASMKTEKGYSDPVTICEKKDTIWRYMSPMLDEDGNWNIVANAYDVKSGLNSIMYVQKAAESKIQMLGAVINEKDGKDGMTGIDYLIKNISDSVIEELELVIDLGEGHKITKKIPVKLQPGESRYDTAYVDLSSINKAQEADVTIYAKDQTDLAGCTAVNKIGLSDISVDKQFTEDNDKVTVNAELKNESKVDGKAVLHLYNDADETKELAASTEMTIKADDRAKVSFTVDKKDLTYNENHAIYLKLKADVLEGDYNEDNNIAYVVLYDKTHETPGTGGSGGSASGSVTPAPAASSSPIPSFAPSALPQTTASPTSTVKPTNMPSPIQKPSASPQASKRPAVISTVKKLKKGDRVTDKKTNAVYRITGTGKNKTAEYVRCTKRNIKKVTVPAAVKLKGNVYRITSIGKNAFKGSKTIKFVKIGKNVRKIGKKAFFRCKNLHYILVQSKKIKAKNVGKDAFSKGSSVLRVKTVKSKKKKYAKIFVKRGMSRKAVFIAKPQKLFR